MKRIITSLPVLMIAAATLLAAPVSPERALAIASDRQSATTAHRAPASRTAAPVLALAAQSDAATADYYVFNYGSADGYVVVAGDDSAPAVLAYSDQGTFDPADMPDGMRVMLDGYAQEIRYLRDHPWLQSAPERSPRDKEVKPLVKSAWNQNAPFNNLCPTYFDEDENSTVHAATGCVATAGAQIMYYHKWPKQGKGSFSYTGKVNDGAEQTMSANFGSTTYDWDNMIDYYGGAYTEAQGSAVATLMYHVGVGSRMSYGSSSSAGPYYLMQALRYYFGYAPDMRFLRRNTMDITEWESLIDNELDNQRPVVYGGFTAKGGGHSFILDGYDKRGYYHFNWGWGGSSNGYFLITALSPRNQGIGSYEGGYNYRQDMIIGIRPDDGNTPPPANSLQVSLESFKPDGDKVELGYSMVMNVSNLGPIVYGNFYHPENEKTLVEMHYLFNLTDLEGNNMEEISEYNHFVANQWVGNTYTYTYNNTSSSRKVVYNPSTTLPDGEYRLWFCWACPKLGINTYNYQTYGNNIPSYINATVRDGFMYFSMPANKVELEVLTFDYPTIVGTNSKFDVETKIHNNGADYYDVVNYLMMQGSETLHFDYGQRVAIAHGTDIISRATVSAPEEPGDYQIAIVDRDGNTIGQTWPLKVVASEGWNLIIDTEVAPTSYKMPSGNITFSAVIKNTGTGDYVGTIPYMILDTDKKSINGSGESKMVTIPAGGKAKVDFTSTFEGIENVVYNLCLKAMNYPDKNYSWGKIVPFEVTSTTGISDARGDGITVNAGRGALTVSGARRVAVYDATGRLVGTGSDHRLPAGIYIVVADATTRKVVVR